MSGMNPIDQLHRRLEQTIAASNAWAAKVQELERRLEAGGGLSALGSGEPRSDIGPVSGYLQDVYNLAPEVLRTEHVRFELRVQNRTIIFQTDPQRVDPEFVLALRRIRITGFCNNVADQNFAGPHITFNIEDQGRGRGGVFLNPISIIETANHNGTYAGEIVWDGFYRFVAAASLRGIWGIDLAQLPATQDIYTFVAAIQGDVLRTRTLPGGAMITSQDGRAR